MKIFSNFMNENDSQWDKLKNFNKPITLFHDYIPKNIEQLQINPYNFIILHEPDEFFGMHTWVLNNYHLFTGILTYNEEILKKCDNATLFIYNCNYHDDKWINSFENCIKKFEVSFLSGAKSLVEGHKLRQEIYKIKDQITIPKKWFYVLDDFNWEDFNKGGIGRPGKTELIDNKIIVHHLENKKFLFKESMFHICVENTKYNYFFSEKINEAFLTKTIPVYWGCPKISEYGYDERGIIRFENIEELINIVNNLTEEKYYELKPYIDHNYNLAKNELVFKDQITLFFTEFTKLNNI
jgi:hypothetical protein